jgi:hypothetical protein
MIFGGLNLLGSGCYEMGVPSFLGLHEVLGD